MKLDYVLFKTKLFYSAISIYFSDLCYFISFLSHKNHNEEVIFSKLRTKVHILDKGLNIVPFEKGHGTSVYRSCQSLSSMIKSDKIKKDPSYKWCQEIINNYENAQKTGHIHNDEYRLHKAITEDERAVFLKIINHRVSCRNFKTELIDNTIWDEIIQIAVLAPNACCRQPARYYIVSESDTIRKLIPNIAGATGFSNNIIPHLICVTADHRAYEVKDRFLPYIDTSLNLENFILGCTSHNIATTILNIQHASKKEIKEIKNILNIPPYERLIAFIAAGRPNRVPTQPKRIGLNWVRKL